MKGKSHVILGLRLTSHIYKSYTYKSHINYYIAYPKPQNKSIVRVLFTFPK